MSTVPLLRCLPFQEVEDNCLLTKDGHLAVGALLTKSPLGTIPPEKLTAQHEKLMTALNLLPNGCIVHFQDIHIRRDPHAMQPTADTSSDWLTAASNRQIQTRQPWVHRSYCYLIKRPEGHPAQTALRALVEPRLVPEVVVDAEERQAFFDAADSFFNALGSAGIGARQLTGEELAGTAEKTGVFEQYLTQNPDYLQPLLEDVHLRKDGVSVGRKELLFFSLADAAQLPPASEPHRRYEPYSTAATDYRTGYATPLGPQLNQDHIYNLFILLDDPNPRLKRLETRRRRLQSLSGKSRTNGVTATEIGAFLDHAAQPRNRPVKLHVNCMVWTDDASKTTILQNETVNAVRATGAIPHLETLCAAQLFMAGIPGNAGSLPSLLCFDGFTGTAACWFIPETGDPGPTAPSGIRLGDRHSGVPIQVDLTDEPLRKGWITNRNRFILGGSGSGKSFFTNHFVHSAYADGAHIVLLDIGGSYKPLCRLVNGHYFECSESHPLSFNPFLLAEGECLDTEKKESLKALLLTLWKKTDEPFRRSEYVALSNLLDGYYEWLQLNPTAPPGFDSFYEWIQTEYQPRSASAGIRETDFDCRNLLYVLRPYYKGGEYDYLLNAREDADLFHQRLIVFDLDAIKDHPILFPVTTIIIMEIFVSKMRKLKGVRKIILLEEAWKAIAKDGMSEYVKYLFKTVRKFYGEAIVVTQDIEDIISSPVVKNSIINNADCKILLDQSKFLHRFDPLQELLGLTTWDKTLVLSLNKANDPDHKYKEVFIGLGPDHSRVYRVEVSLEEYLVYTTEESERLKVSQYSEKHGGLVKGLTELAADIRSGAVKLLLTAIITTGFLLLPRARASAQLFDVVEDAIKEALETADLKIQRLQTQTLWLQNSQKVLENSMAGSLLDDIGDWARQQEELFNDYYTQLWQVKDVFDTYGKTLTLLRRQEQLVKAWQSATAAVRADPHLAPGEMEHILAVYDGILEASIRNAGRLETVITDFATQMDDAGRLRLIDETAEDLDRDYTTLTHYTQETSLLSLRRAHDQADIRTIKTLYGLP